MTNPTKPPLDELTKIQQAIAAQEALRGILPDEQIDATLAALRQAELVAKTGAPPDHAWGMRFNVNIYQFKDYPKWCTRLQRDKWDQSGLILWDERQQQVTKLSGAQAFKLLTFLQDNEIWQEDGITVGEPVTVLTLDDPEQPPRPDLANQISFVPAQCRELLTYLTSYQEQIKALAKREDDERGHILADVYTFLLGKEVMDQISLIYRHEPETALKLMQELVSKQLDALNPKDE